MAPYSVMNDSDGNRTRVTAVKGRCLNRLTTEPDYQRNRLAPRAGLEPATPRLTAACSTIELSRQNGLKRRNDHVVEIPDYID